MPGIARVFIGSSSEGLPAAQAVRSLLARDAEITLWNEGLFRPGLGFLESLSASLDMFDFAILVATADDMVMSRDQVHLSPRDNILFELGLFMGRLGRERTFLVHPRDRDLKLPTDLLGVTTAACDWPAPGPGHGSRPALPRYMSALGAACDQIREAINGWTARTATGTAAEPGLIRCYTNSTEAQMAIGKAISAARNEISLMATNFSYTPALSVLDLQDKITQGVHVRFMVLNPLSEHVPHIAADYLFPESQFRDENRLHLQIVTENFYRYAKNLPGGAGKIGRVDIRLYDTVPRMRVYSFDGPGGESFFVPYVNRTLPRPLPVYHCANDGALARRYLEGMERLWNAPDTLPIDLFAAHHPGTLPRLPR